MEVDHVFIIQIASLFQGWKRDYLNNQDNLYSDELPTLDEFDKLSHTMIEDARYKKLYQMLNNLNSEDYLDFLTIYYLGKGSINSFERGREEVKAFGNHPIEKMLKKFNLDLYLNKGDKLR